MFEGPMNITAVATNDGATTTLTSEVMVLNVAPTLSAPSLFKGGEEVMSDENGTHLNEDEVALCGPPQAIPPTTRARSSSNGTLVGR